MYLCRRGDEGNARENFVNDVDVQVLVLGVGGRGHVLRRLDDRRRLVVLTGASRGQDGDLGRVRRQVDVLRLVERRARDRVVRR